MAETRRDRRGIVDSGRSSLVFLSQKGERLREKNGKLAAASAVVTPAISNPAVNPEPKGAEPPTVANQPVNAPVQPSPE